MRRKFLGAIVLLALALAAPPGKAQTQNISMRSAETAVPALARPDTSRYVSYFDTTQAAYYYSLQSDGERLTLRFSPPLTGTLDSVFFAINDSSGQNRSPVRGEGRLRIRLTDTTAVSGAGTDEAVIVPRSYRDSVTVPLSSLEPGVFNAVVFDAAVIDTVDYIVEFDVLAEDRANVQFVLDDGSAGGEDDAYFPARTFLARSSADTTGYFTFACESCGEEGTDNANLVATLRVTRPVGSGVAGRGDSPGGPRLAPVYPNPVRRVTRVPFVLDRSSRVTLAVYDVLGRRVATLVADRRMTAGAHRVRWRAEGVPSGTYFARLETNGTVRTQAVTVVR